jgi:outer membrane protein TolC
MAGTRLALLTGLPADQPINPVTPLPDSGQALTLEKNRENDGSSKDATLPDPQELVREALKERGDLAEQRSTLRAAETAERTARSGWFPQLFLVGEYTYARPNPEVFPTENQFNSSWRLGIAGRIELGGMPRVYHRVARRGAEREAAAARLRQAEQQVRLAVREAYLEWKSSGEELALARTIVRRAEENLSETRTRVENGAALNEDLLEAQAVLLEARLSLTSAEIGRQIARDRLMRELGREL